MGGLLGRGRLDGRFKIEELMSVVWGIMKSCGLLVSKAPDVAESDESPSGHGENTLVVLEMTLPSTTVTQPHQHTILVFLRTPNVSDLLPFRSARLDPFLSPPTPPHGQPALQCHLGPSAVDDARQLR